VSTAEISLQLPGREHAWWVWSDRGVFDEHGRLLEVQAVGRDNTEVRRSQQQLTQSAKMATLGEMATGLAHEINQPLNVMRMAIVNVLKRLGNGDVQIDYLTDKLNRIDAQVQRAAKVVDHMRVFGRRSEVEQQPFNPARPSKGRCRCSPKACAAKVSTCGSAKPGFSVQVRGYVDQLEQVLINLMVNARMRCSANAKPTPNPGFRCTPNVKQSVRLWVEDNGGGIDPRLLERIFEPFFTTKPVGRRHRLGLSVSYGIVENMGGKLSVRNSTGGRGFASSCRLRRRIRSPDRLCLSPQVRLKPTSTLMSIPRLHQQAVHDRVDQRRQQATDGRCQQRDDVGQRRQQRTQQTAQQTANGGRVLNQRDPAERALLQAADHTRHHHRVRQVPTH
jgi:signal transduction histidine kinase